MDLEHRVLTIARSYGKETTKGGHADAIPIAEPLVPFLADAIARSPSQLVFTREGGGMWPKWTALENKLRRTLARAGLVQGFDHTCRRCKRAGKPQVERHQDAALRLCPTCGMRLWPVPIHRKMRFHDLRQTTATLLLRAGVDPYRVQRILRHKDVRTTTMIYGHLDVEDLRDAVNQLAPGIAVASEEGIPAEMAVEQGGAVCYALATRGVGGEGKGRDRSGESAKSPGP